MTNGTAYGTSPLKRHRRTKAELDAINEAIIAVAEAEKPITVRGLFYRVMSLGLVPKSEKGYDVIQRQALKLRRAGELEYSHITDGSRLRLEPTTWSSAKQALASTAHFYRQNLWIDQGVHVEFWSEKDAIRGVVYPVTAEYHVPLMIARGFSSETFLYETAEDINTEGNPTVIYQLGDHDPSGIAAWQQVQDRLTDLVDPRIDIEFERIAVTPEQIVEYDLPTRPTKQSDTRARNFEGDSVEIDAIPTSTLRGLVREAIEMWIDPEALRLTRIAEDSERDILLRIANDAA
jgi:hypothetical protein